MVRLKQDQWAEEEMMIDYYFVQRVSSVRYDEVQVEMQQVKKSAELLEQFSEQESW